MVQKWLGYVEVVEVCGSIYDIWQAPETKFGEKMDGKRGGGWRCCCQGSDVRVEGRMSGLDGPDVRALDSGTNGMNTAWRG